MHGCHDIIITLYIKKKLKCKLYIYISLTEVFNNSSVLVLLFRFKLIKKEKWRSNNYEGKKKTKGRYIKDEKIPDHGLKWHRY